MRPTHKNRSRNRHRSGGSSGGGGGNPLSRVYESNGPDVKVRGTAQTVADKYLQLGRDAQSSGDNVMAESYFQHAEHYLRIVFAAQAYNQQNQQQYRRPDEDFDEDDLEDQQDAASEQRGGAQQAGEPDGLGDQPAMEGGPERSQQQQQNRPPREQRDYGRDNRDHGQSRDRYRPRWQDRRSPPLPIRAVGKPRPSCAVRRPPLRPVPRVVWWRRRVRTSPPQSDAMNAAPARKPPKHPPTANSARSQPRGR